MDLTAPETGTKSLALNKPRQNDPPWLLEALKLDGLKEIPGKSHNAEIVKMFAEAGHSGIKDDETAWCAAFVGAMLRRAGYASTGALTARSYLGLGNAVITPDRGDIAVLSRGSSEWQGHVAFVLKADNDFVWLFGGNQNNAVNLTRYARSKVLGFRRPVARQVNIVLEVQKRLTQLGYNPASNVDGIMGPTTKTAIAAYEIAKGFAPFDNIEALHRHLTKPASATEVPATPKPAHTKPTAPVAPAKPGNSNAAFWIIIVGLAALAAYFLFFHQFTF